jgi:hypothetical protein
VSQRTHENTPWEKESISSKFREHQCQIKKALLEWDLSRYLPILLLTVWLWMCLRLWLESCGEEAETLVPETLTEKVVPGKKWSHFLFAMNSAWLSWFSIRFLFFYFFFVVLGFELKAYTLSHSPSPFFYDGFFRDKTGLKSWSSWSLPPE